MVTRKTLLNAHAGVCCEVWSRYSLAISMHMRRLAFAAHQQPQVLVTVLLHFKWNTVFIFTISHGSYFTLRVRMDIEIAKP